MMTTYVLPTELQKFINEQVWTFAKTMPLWPHEYIVRDRVDESNFEKLAKHIRSHGYEGRFYKREITYFDQEGVTYWTMGSPISETTIVNRCLKKDTYEDRLRAGTLPEQTQAVRAAQLTGHLKRGLRPNSQMEA